MKQVSIFKRNYQPIVGWHLLAILIFIAMGMSSIFTHGIFGKVYLNADSYGYIYPAFEYVDSEKLKLIYGRPFVWPFIMSLFAGPKFEEWISLLNISLLLAMPLPLLFASIDAVGQMRQTRWKVFLLFMFSLALFVLFFNASILRWYFYALPESFCMTVSAWVLYYVCKSCLRTPSFSDLLICSILCALLMYAKPSMLIYSASALVIVSIRPLKNQKLFVQILMVLMLLSPVMVVGSINNHLVNKYDYVMSERFKYGSIICSNGLFVRDNIAKKENKSHDDLVIKSALDAIESEGPGSFSLLGFNPDACMYSSGSIYAKFDEIYGWNVTHQHLKEYVKQIAFAPSYLLSRAVDQISYALVKPLYQRGGIVIDDRDMEKFNREGLSNNSIEEFWRSHDWGKKTVLTRNSYRVYWVTILVALALLMYFRRPDVKTSAVILVQILSAYIVVSVAASFDVERYRDTLMPLIVSGLFYISTLISNEPSTTRLADGGASNNKAEV
jgi:hypothetical protein